MEQRDKTKQKRIPIWRRLQVKFACSYLLLIAAALSFLNTYPILAAQDLVFEAKQASLLSSASVISSSVSLLGEVTSDGVAQVMEMLDEGSVSRVMVTNPSGLIVYDSQATTDHKRYALIQELSIAMQGASGNDVSVCTYRDGAFRTRAAMPIMYRNSLIGGVYLYEYDAQQGAIITGLQHNLLRISAGLVGVSLLISLLLSRTMTRRISTVISGIDELREGDYTTRVQVSGKDELADLATAFNDMTERMQTTDEMRKRFVSDASHELKTPLAAIKLLTDSIAMSDNMDSETMREFVDDIGTEADRLVRITGKLLALTKMDNSASDLKTEPVDLGDVICDALHMLNPLADQKHISIQPTIEQGCIVRSSPDEMYQVLFNLVENAIKYNSEGGKVWIRARTSAENAIVTIEDNGIGIPKEDRPKIFDRFYRVDKARSREAGGTGLGLSIVKDTVVHYKGTILVDARPEGGTVFIVTLPLYQQKEKKEKEDEP